MTHSIVKFAAVFLLCTSAAYAGDDASTAMHSRDGHESHVLKVVDARGKDVGRFSTLLGHPGVYLPIDGALVFVGIERKQFGTNEYSASQFQWAGDLSVSYISNNCTGTPLVNLSLSPRPDVVIRTGADVTLYIGTNRYSGGVQVGSTYDATGGPATAHCDASSFPGDTLWDVQRSISLAQKYPEPLRIGY